MKDEVVMLGYVILELCVSFVPFYNEYMFF